MGIIDSTWRSGAWYPTSEGERLATLRGMSDTSALAKLRNYQRLFEASIAEADPAAPVLSCGDWTVRDLVEHLAGVYTWAAHRAGGPKVRLVPGDDLAAHYAAAAAAIEQTFTELDPDEPCWTLLDDEAPEGRPRLGTRRFWHRRQAMETLVHLWDLRTAAGLGLEISAEDWLDCAEEVVSVMQPRQLRLGRISAPQTQVVLEPVDGSQLVLAGAPADAAVVTVRGSSEQIALLLWGRTDADDLEVTGDRTALAAALVGVVP
ncbi:MAG: maleylpyruvate isomerase family mycothiol-dependent enzyme [Propionicimonas sp.]|nr:maleylpyruvate isomerase family mycothiol-dependent enzyme [Propionicimonas sp.]